MLALAPAQNLTRSSPFDLQTLVHAVDPFAHVKSHVQEGFIPRLQVGVMGRVALLVGYPYSGNRHRHEHAKCLTRPISEGRVIVGVVTQSHRVLAVRQITDPIFITLGCCSAAFVGHIFSVGLGNRIARRVKESPEEAAGNFDFFRPHHRYFSGKEQPLALARRLRKRGAIFGASCQLEFERLCPVGLNIHGHGSEGKKRVGSSV